jgi:hypothetical protein
MTDQLTSVIYRHLIPYFREDMNNSDFYNWETKNEAKIKRGIRSFLYEMKNIKYPKPPPEPLPPPNWQTIHIGDGIFVEMENPELNCEGS